MLACNVLGRRVQLLDHSQHPITRILFDVEVGLDAISPPAGCHTALLVPTRDGFTAVIFTTSAPGNQQQCWGVLQLDGRGGLVDIGQALAEVPAQLARAPTALAQPTAEHRKPPGRCHSAPANVPEGSAGEEPDSWACDVCHRSNSRLSKHCGTCEAPLHHDALMKVCKARAECEGKGEERIFYSHLKQAPMAKPAVLVKVSMALNKVFGIGGLTFS